MSARDKIMRFAEENQPSVQLVYDPETGYAVDDPEAHLSGLLDAYRVEVLAEAGVELPNRPRSSS